jgi:hypothetical protein
MNINVIFVLLMLVFPTEQTIKQDRKWIVRSVTDLYEEDNEYSGPIIIFFGGGEGGEGENFLTRCRIPL